MDVIDIEDKILEDAKEYYKQHGHKLTALHQALCKNPPQGIYSEFDITSVEYLQYLNKKYTDEDLKCPN